MNLCVLDNGTVVGVPIGGFRHTYADFLSCIECHDAVVTRRVSPPVHNRCRLIGFISVCLRQNLSTARIVIRLNIADLWQNSTPGSSIGANVVIHGPHACTFLRTNLRGIHQKFIDAQGTKPVFRPVRIDIVNDRLLVFFIPIGGNIVPCLLYTSDAADE